MALDFFAGVLGGCAGVVVGHPFDTVKIKIQTQDFRNPIYKGTYSAFKGIIKNESVSALFKGMSSPMFGVAFVNGIIFGVYGSVQRSLPNPDSIASVTIAGTVAGLVQSVITSPMELVKTRLQVQQTQIYKGPFDCLKQIYRTQGVRGVFQGFNITALREGPGFASYFLVYELLTKSEDDISTARMLMAGGTAGSASWAMAYPVDVIKSRLQIDGMNGPRQYKNSIDCLNKSIQQEGYRFLMRGVNTAIIRAFPVNAVTWAVVSWTMRLFDKKQKETTFETISQYVEKCKFEDFYLTKAIFNLHTNNLLLLAHNNSMNYFPKVIERRQI